jgi:hypothetical protein
MFATTSGNRLAGSKELRQKYGTIGRERAVRQFTWDRGAGIVEDRGSDADQR